MKIFTARVGDDTYPVTIGSQALTYLGNFLSGYSKNSVLVIADSFFKSANAEYTEDLFNILDQYPTFFIDGGLTSKDIRGYCSIINWLTSKDVPRDGLLVAIGGGVIGDLVAFVASTYLRGISLVHVPTTTTSMIDSSVGGKTGINHCNQVNLIGSYYNPDAIFADTRFLNTLEDRDYKAGICEAIKMATTSDKKYAYFLAENYSLLNPSQRDSNSLEDLVTWSVKTKLLHVSDDAKEKSIRLILNYGHTFGQSIESYYGVNQDHLRHGEAVALGMICAAKASDLINESLFCLEFTKDILEKFELPVKVGTLHESDMPNTKTLVNNLIKDKKRLTHGNRFILLKSIGEAEVCFIDQEKILAESFNEIL